jgi:gas vesicle protein
MKSFLMGLGIGIGLGVLFAPMSGEETRTRISESASDLADSARDTMEQGRDRVQRGVSAIRGAAERAANRISGSEPRPTGTETPNL